MGGLIAGRAGAQVTSAPPVAPTQNKLSLTVRSRDADRYEYGDRLLSVPQILKDQWNWAHALPEESLNDLNYLRTFDPRVARMTLNEAVYWALKNNPQVEVGRLNPLAAVEAVKQAAAAFDPRLLANGERLQSYIPITSALDTVNTVTKQPDLGLSTNQWQWNFAINKLLASSNGVLSVLFNNSRINGNNFFESVRPFYVPTLTLSLTQPLLRAFGWKFATINVRLAHSALRQAQFNYEQTLQDLVYKVATDYWAVVLARDQLKVAEQTVAFYDDLVRDNMAQLKVGTLAPLDVREAQAAAETAQANLFSARAVLGNAEIVLAQDVMLNNADSFLPRTIEPIDHPNPDESMVAEEEHSLEDGFAHLPSLAAARAAISSAAINVQYMDNQMLPSLTLGSQVSLTSQAGELVCNPPLGASSSTVFNCTTIPGVAFNGETLPEYRGGYGTALSQMFSFRYLTYIFSLNFEMPADDAYLRAMVAQARMQATQLHRQYQAAVDQMVVNVRSAVANVAADIQTVKASRARSAYARAAFYDEQKLFANGMATTHDLIQYQTEDATVEANELQAEINLEDAKLALRHANGNLLRQFRVDFHLSPPPPRPWYDTF
ncbi:MAG TPA: TolC family protein [Candidatus Binataceae bacterium]|nr:TolC family protein [Candidatus Binataceae bacterium]